MTPPRFLLRMSEPVLPYASPSPSQRARGNELRCEHCMTGRGDPVGCVEHEGTSGAGSSTMTLRSSSVYRADPPSRRRLEIDVQMRRRRYAQEPGVARLSTHDGMRTRMSMRAFGPAQSAL